MRASRGGLHISGAEGLYDMEALQLAIMRYSLRAMEHPRGVPDSMVISIERLRQRPKAIPALPLCTLGCGSPREAKALIGEILKAVGVSEEAARRAFGVINGRTAMRGAALIAARDGRRLDPDPARGVRASRLGIEEGVLRSLGRRLSRLGLNNMTVTEALAIASKVASARGIIAEICASDDPDYDTGYVASRRFGYVRIPKIKQAGSRRGGRAFFVREGGDVQGIVEYLEKRPVMVTGLSGFRGIRDLDEIIRG
jgi:6-carboxyhexanoate--CoA ligase